MDPLDLYIDLYKKDELNYFLSKSFLFSGIYFLFMFILSGLILIAIKNNILYLVLLILTFLMFIFIFFTNKSFFKIVLLCLITALACSLVGLGLNMPFFIFINLIISIIFIIQAVFINFSYTNHINTISLTLVSASIGFISNIILSFVLINIDLFSIILFYFIYNFKYYNIFVFALFYIDGIKIIL